MTNILRKIPWWSGDKNTTIIEKATEILGTEFVCNNTQTLLGRTEQSPLIEPVLYSEKELAKAAIPPKGKERKIFLVYLHGLSHAKLHDATNPFTRKPPLFFFLPEYKKPWWLNPENERQEWAYKGFESGYYLINLRMIPDQGVWQKVKLKKDILLPSKIFGNRTWQRIPGNMLAEAQFSLYQHFGKRVCTWKKKEKEGEPEQVEELFHVIPPHDNNGVGLRYEPFDGSLMITSYLMDRPGSGMFTYLPRHKPLSKKD